MMMAHSQLWFDAWRSLAATLSRPALPSRTPNPAEEAAAVRAMADRYRRSDPGFASDLDAAVARFEAQTTQAG